MTTNKAAAGGTTALIASAIWSLIASAMWIMQLTMEQQIALESLVVGAVTWVIIYFSPANTEPTR